MRAARPSARTQVLVVGAGDDCAVGFIGAVRAVLVSVAVVGCGDAQSVAASKLSAVARWEAWNLLKNMSEKIKFRNFSTLRYNFLIRVVRYEEKVRTLCIQ